MVQAFLISTGLVALAEIGDKTQLLSFVLAARLRRPYPIMLGIFVATLANHAMAGSLGAWVAHAVPAETLRWVVGLSFIGFAAWAIKPDEPGSVSAMGGKGAFMTTFIAFFIAEIGDKTQFATVALAARYDALAMVVLGTTLGMMIANIPAVMVGETLAHRINMKWVRRCAAVSFALLGAATLFADRLPGIR